MNIPVIEVRAWGKLVGAIAPDPKLGYYVRFQNKTSDTLVLGYADGSEMVLDDQGNRYVPNPYGNAYRGIGLVSGNNMDPKFVMRPGSWGDARSNWFGGPVRKIPLEVRLSMR